MYDCFACSCGCAKTQALGGFTDFLGSIMSSQLGSSVINLGTSAAGALIAKEIGGPSSRASANPIYIPTVAPTNQSQVPATQFAQPQSLATSPSPNGLPSWVLPVGIGAVVLLFLATKRK